MIVEPFFGIDRTNQISQFSSFIVIHACEVNKEQNKNCFSFWFSTNSPKNTPKKEQNKTSTQYTIHVFYSLEITPIEVRMQKIKCKRT